MYLLYALCIQYVFYNLKQREQINSVKYNIILNIIIIKNNYILFSNFSNKFSDLLNYGKLNAGCPIW